MNRKVINARFYQSATGKEPVKDWLKSLSQQDRKAIGDDIRTAEFGWPVGMPICRSIRGHKGLWEVRTRLPDGRISRVFFCIYADQMILLHCFIKKSQKTPDKELDVAVKRMKGLKEQ